MIRRGFNLFLTVCILSSGLVSSPAQTSNSSPNFQDVYNLIRQHAAGVSEAELNRAAVQGLIGALSPQVSLVTNEATGHASDAPPVSQAKVFEGDIAYLRIAQVGPGIAEAVSSAFQQLNSTNKVSGVVLDLRYTDGSDYPAAASAADLFVRKSEPLLSWNGSVVSSHEKTNAITIPIAVIVNHETAGASEAFAAMLREAGSALILGSHTAGRAMLTQDYPLANGNRLRIASAPITLGDGVRLSTAGLKPDIDVTVSLEDERAFYADAFLVVQKTNHVADSSNNVASETNQSIERVPFNEAELVREHKAGANPDEDTVKRPPEPKVRMVSDPALARALDLLKGLAVVRQGRS